MINTSETTRGISDIILTIAAFIFSAVAVDISWQVLAVAIGGSICGAAALGYFRSERNKWDTMFKIVTSMTGGFVLGAVVEEYYQIESWRYRLAIYFTASIISIALFRSILNLTEKNAAEILQSVLQRLLNLRTTAENTEANKLTILKVEKTTDAENTRDS